MAHFLEQSEVSVSYDDDQFFPDHLSVSPAMFLSDLLGPDSDHSSPSSASLSIESILRARERIRPFLHGQTPVFSSASLNSLCGDKELFFKCENLQKTGSFKARGAMNAVRKKRGTQPTKKRQSEKFIFLIFSPSPSTN